ncbi:MAG: glycoside hydrolase family 65 protein, partial [Bacteroidaceae bacterium]
LWQLTATNTKSYVGAPVANGGIGILPWSEPFSVRHVILNHVFDSNGARGISRVLRGINPFLLSMEIDGQKITKDNIGQWNQTIDMKEATHNTSFVGMEKVTVNYSICALRNMPYAGLIRVEVKALDNVQLKVINTMDVPTEYGTATTAFKTLRDGSARQIMFQTSASSAQGAQQVAASASFLYPNKKFTTQYNEEKKIAYFEKQLKKGETLTFALAGAICSTRDFTDPYGESERQVVYANHEGTDRLMTAHRSLWNELWKGDILIEGDDDAQRNVRFALYNLYSYCREGSGLSISPMGLSAQGYNGHIFWDTEIWMYPSMLLLNKDIAESMINYRTDRLKEAQKKAYIHGYKGAMFPWQSGHDGGEE